MKSRTPLTIALLLGTPGTTWGGMEKHTAELATGLSQRGHRVHVFAHENYRKHFRPPVRFDTCPMQLGRRNPLLKWRIKRTLRTIRPDIVHAQGNKAANLVQAMKPPTGIRLGTIHGTKSSLSAFRHLEGVITVNHETAKHVPNKNCRVIYNGISTDTAGTETALQLPERSGYALAVGRLEPVKQFDRLIEAWGVVRTDIPLYILGEGSQRSALEGLVTKLGLSGTIQLPGYETNVQPWLSSASVCLISSSREGFPYFLVESLVAGCPVLSTPVNGAREFLPADCMAQSTSTESIADLLRRQLHHPDKLRGLEQASFIRAREKLTSDAMVNQTERFYYDLLGNRSGPVT